MSEPVVRKPPRAPRERKPRRPELSRAHTHCIDKPDFASWCNSQQLDAAFYEGGERRDLSSLAYEIESSPWLLSQVGPTKSSLRGVLRLDELALDASREGGASTAGALPVFAVIHEKDGLEIRGEATAPRRARATVAASVGIGAIRTKVSGTSSAGGAGEAPSTVASRLSASVLAALDEFAVGRSGINLKQCIDALPVDAPFGDEAKVQLVRHVKRRQIIAKVSHSSTSQPKAWWVVSGSTVSSEAGVESAVVSDKVASTGVTYRPSADMSVDGKRVLLALCCPLADGAGLVRIENEIARGTIGQGWTVPEYGKAKPIAVYAERRPLKTNEELIVQQIHLAKPRQVHELWPLPIAVPTR